MKRALLMAAFVVLGATTALLAQPKLEIEGGNTYDWGVVGPKQSPLEAEVYLKNVGDKELIISKVKPGCGCTTAPLEKDRLQPGEKTKIDVTLRVNNSSGPIQKSITITSNDVENAKTILYLKANINRPIQVSPRYLYFNDMETGQKATANVTIRNTSKRDVKLSDIVTDSGVTLNIGKTATLKAGGSLDVVATVVPQKKGYFSATITMNSDHPEYDKVEVKGYGNVKEPEKSKVFID